MQHLKALDQLHLVGHLEQFSNLKTETMKVILSIIGILIIGSVIYSLRHKFRQKQDTANPKVMKKPTPYKNGVSYDDKLDKTGEKKY